MSRAAPLPVQVEGMPQWFPSEMPFIQTQLWTIEKEGANLHSFTFGKAGTGTHFDSANHVIPGRRRVHEYGPADLIGPVCVVDVRFHAEREADYAVQPQDLLNFEREHGRIPKGSIVLMDSGWTERWPDPIRVLNMDSEGERRFPGFSAEAAALIVERGIKGLAVDTMSLDNGSNANLDAHRVILGADLYGVENVKIVAGLPAMGATLIVAPLKLQDGSESPTRVFAYV
jgi:kynurenine formamidase